MVYGSHQKLIFLLMLVVGMLFCLTICIKVLSFILSKNVFNFLNICALFLYLLITKSQISFFPFLIRLNLFINSKKDLWLFDQRFEACIGIIK